MKHRAAFVGMLIALSAAPSQAEPLACEPGSRPFLELVERTVFRRVGQQPPPAQTLPVETGGTLVCRDARVLFARVHTVPGETLAQRVQIERGRADAVGWSELVELAATARIGTLESCRLSSPNQLVLQHELRVTWHGRAGRQNTFRIALDDLSRPPCSEEVRELWFSIMSLSITIDAAERVNIH